MKRLPCTNASEDELGAQPELERALVAFQEPTSEAARVPEPGIGASDLAAWRLWMRANPPEPEPVAKPKLRVESHWEKPMIFNDPRSER